ncbi:hypothetical protein [Paenibacillus sophorae]|nr:hypothetical protein [Paenibacillus sophorae]QWU13158.1 hypothetical protein KP014_14105 [Paenibacillus sophorae]
MRWNIETSYRYFRELLGFNQYQLLSFEGIRQYWAIQYMTQNFLESQRQDWMNDGKHLTLGDVVYPIRQEYFGQIMYKVNVK